MKVLHHRQEGHATAANVIQQFKKRKRLVQKNEHCQKHCKMKKELSEDIKVHQTGKAAARRRRRLVRAALSVCRMRRCRARPGLRPSAAGQTNAPNEVSDRPQPVALSAKLLHPRQQSQTQNRENPIGHPNSRRRRDLPLPRQPCTHDEQQVVRSDQHDCQQGSCRASTAPRLRA